ncbi:hypothetical protein MHYP_G00317070 [Metynnis hypsauchen]
MYFCTWAVNSSSPSSSHHSPSSQTENTTQTHTSCTSSNSPPSHCDSRIRLMAMTSSQLDHCELEGGEENMKPRAAAVRRNLFGPVDHQQLHQDFQRLLCMSMEVAKQRWNFDFQSEQPAAGPVEWEELRWQDVPAFYRSCVVRAGTISRRLEAPVNPIGSLGCSSVAVSGEEYLELRARAAFRGPKLEKRMSAPLGVKHRQATITDFFTLKKRRFLHRKGASRQ